MDSVPETPTLGRALRAWWRENRAHRGTGGALRMLGRELAEFLRDSTPARLRARYGDIDYDCDYRVDTTWANVGWRLRLHGVLAGGGYQPCEPALFHETLEKLGVDFTGFTFVDIGSGKGRALLMASDYPFARILGVELLPELHAIAERNIAVYRSDRQQCRRIESLCQDARSFRFPAGPLVVFLFNPLPQPALAQVIANLEDALAAHPRSAYVVYHNPILEYLLSQNPRWKRLDGTIQFCLYEFALKAPALDS